MFILIFDEKLGRFSMRSHSRQVTRCGWRELELIQTRLIQKPMLWVEARCPPSWGATPKSRKDDALPLGSSLQKITRRLSVLMLFPEHSSLVLSPYEYSGVSSWSHNTCTLPGCPCPLARGQLFYVPHNDDLMYAAYTCATASGLPPELRLFLVDIFRLTGRS